MNKWSTSVIAWFLATSLLWGQERALTNADVVRMVEAGMGAELIVEKIAASAADFQTGVDDLVELKSKGVPEAVIRAMVRKTEGKPIGAASQPEPGPRTLPPRDGLSEEYFNGATLFRPVGTKTDKIGGTLKLEPEVRRLRFIGKKAGEPLLDVPYQRVQKLVYEKSKKPRYALAVFVSPLFFFTKSKKHWLTIEYGEPGQELDTVIVRLDKRNVDAALRAVERHTGIKVDYQATID